MNERFRYTENQKSKGQKSEIWFVREVVFVGIIEKMRLDGKKGFVTGGARGIGKATATAFAEAGADIAIVDLDIQEAKKTAEEIAKATGRKVIALQCDVTKEDQVQKWLMMCLSNGAA